jgi:LmbE family N-acetylglucosaminyl deacetylase
MVNEPTSVLTVLAHPDDAELWAGGTLAAHAATGAVTIAVPRHDPVRDAEAATGATILGAHLHLLDAMTTKDVGRLLQDVRPDVVICHRVDDVHPDHRTAADVLLAALPAVVIATGRPKRVYTCDTYNSLTIHGPVPASTIIDITSTRDAKLRALEAHASQPIAEHFGPMAEALARLSGTRIGTRYAEAFQAVPVLGRLPAVQRL